MSDFYKTATLSADDTYTDWLDGAVIRKSVIGGAFMEGDLSISGSYVGVLTLQRRFKDSAVAIKDAHIFVTGEETEDTFRIAPDTEVRIGFKPGTYTSGTASVRLGLGVVS